MTLGNFKRCVKLLHQRLQLSKIRTCRMISSRIAREKPQDKLQDMKSDAFKIFLAGVDAVMPKSFITKALKVDNERLLVQDFSYHIANNVYVVGFGKAVAGMARAVEDIIGHHLVEGVISIPEGTTDIMSQSGKRDLLPGSDSKILVLEGAKHNLPDKNSSVAADCIISLVKKLKATDILLVLISGGGSALFPAPVPPVTLDEKIAVIKLLSTRGATIQEMNSVRKQLSVVKGGGLAAMAKPAQVVSLILSDIVGDPLDLIASGPTVRNTDDASYPLEILKKYNIENDVPQSVLCVLKKPRKVYEEKDLYHVQNFLIGTNKQALEAARATAFQCNYHPCVLTMSLQGEAKVVGWAMAYLAVMCQELNNLKRIEEPEVEKLCTALCVSKSSLIELLTTLETHRKGFCIICGGETIVKVTGQGKGGRNQEMALEYSLQNYYLSNSQLSRSTSVLLSAGTDGIDGPTDAAGAFGYHELILRALEQGLDPGKYLSNNDSYGFYLKCNGGNDLIKIGHTGTNVMDIQVLLIRTIQD
ncbi:glycerate kinase-like isoform X2 [Limulus polyphemus]|uniref:Glycerate kinase-like isoform X2 n=1 Tax=Limulus polyphemus TaxID=6850 RepID=A0ABM1SB43_LIMPO|nr:glycerate kinase-like isoform X2 [Limulus polyphemus]